MNDALSPERIEKARYDAQIALDHYSDPDFAETDSRMTAETVLALLDDRARLGNLLECVEELATQRRMGWAHGTLAAVDLVCEAFDAWKAGAK